MKCPQHFGIEFGYTDIFVYFSKKGVSLFTLNAIKFASTILYFNTKLPSTNIQICKRVEAGIIKTYRPPSPTSVTNHHRWHHHHQYHSPVITRHHFFHHTSHRPRHSLYSPDLSCSGVVGGGGGGLRRPAADDGRRAAGDGRRTTDGGRRTAGVGRRRVMGSSRSRPTSRWCREDRDSATPAPGPVAAAVPTAVCRPGHWWSAPLLPGASTADD